MSAAFFPLIAACFYGLAYVFYERVFTGVNMTTFYFCGAMTGLVTTLCYGLWNHQPVSFAFAKETPSLLIMLALGVMSSYLGWLLTTHGIKGTSAVYAAMGEISYPLFTVLFAFLLFGARNWSLSTLLGGALIMIGSFILVYGQTRASAG